MRGRFPRPNRTPIKPWYQRAGGARLSSDRALLAESYPSLKFRVDDGDTCVLLEGKVVIVTECGIPTAIATVIKFPWDYPSSEPVAYDVEKRFRPWPGKELADRHLFADGRCCLWLPPRSRWNPRDHLALRSFVDELVVFLDRQLVYDITGTWPGPEYDHGPEGYIQFITEQLEGNTELTRTLLPVIAKQTSVGRNDRCACGSEKKFKHCHLQIVEEIQRQIRVENIKRIFVTNMTNGKSKA